MAFKSDRRLYLSRDKSKVLEVGDTDAGWLFVALGAEITEADAVAYGLDYREGKVILPRVEEPKAVAEPKQAKKGEDKSLKRGGDKSAPVRPGADKS